MKVTGGEGVKYVETVLLLLLLPVALSGCAATGEKTSDMPGRDDGRKSVRDSVTIKPSGSYEECIELHEGQVFDYEFDASGTVNFNIHYHAVTGLYYPVDKKGVGFGKGTLDPGAHPFYTSEQEYYCLMWENPGDGPVRVSYKCVVRGK
jgi:hypothetical protein